MPESLKKMFDLSYVSYRYVMNNRKALLATLLGLVIGATIMAASAMLVDSYNSELIDEILYSEERSNFSGDIQIDLTPTVDSGELAWINDFDVFPHLVNESFGQADYEGYFIKQQWFGEFLLGYWLTFPLAYQNYHPAFVRSVELDLLASLESYLNPGSRLPNNYTEIIVVSMQNESFLEIGQVISVGISPADAYWATSTAVNVSIVGMLDYEKVEDLFLELYFLQLNPLKRESMPPDSFFMIASLENALNLTNQIMNENFKAISSIYGKIFLDNEKFNVYSLPFEKEKLNALFTQINNRFVNIENGSLSIEVMDVYGLLENLDAAIEDVRILQVLLLLIDIPVIAIAIYLVSFSSSLIKRQKKETIGILKTRGGSWQQITVFLLGESVVVIGITLISGLSLGYVVTSTIIRSIGFLDFSGAELPVVVTASHIQLLLFFVVGATIIINTSAIIQYTRMTIQESVIPVEESTPVWKNYYIDVFAILLGLGGYIVLTELGRIIGSSLGPLPLLTVVFLIVGVPTPFLLFFGVILLISRLFPVFLDRLAQFLWRKRGKLGAFALRNVVRHKEAASQAVILITLAISYTIISGSLTVSVDETKKMGYYFYTGADLKINIVGEYSNQSFLDEVRNVSGISRVTQTFFTHTPSETGRQYYVFSFVDPKTYAEVAFFDESRFGLSSPLSDLMDKIADNKSIILSKSNLDEQPNLEIHDAYGFHFYNKTLFYAGVSDYRNYSIVGTFNLWPQLQEYEWAPSGAIFAVASIGMFYDLNTFEYLAIEESSVLCELEPSADPAEVYYRVKYLSHKTPHTYSAIVDYQNYLASTKRRFMIAVLNAALLACILVTVLGSVMFSLFTFLERGKERGVERALGMTRIQTAKLFAMEGSIILLIGIIVGFGVGLTNTSIFLLVFEMGRTIPPIVVNYPLEFITFFLAFVILVASIGTLIIAFQSSKKDISRVLKVE
ncbi:MAG: FtsX-like permease family protein [Candidatus Thorarchaeota archaeon]